MRPIKLRGTMLFVVLAPIIILSACSKKVSTGEPDRPPITPGTPPGICDFDVTDASVQAAGWTKIFDEPFDGDLSQWNTWTGGAFNDEYQHYQPSNLTVSSGTLKIQAKRENVTGVTTPWNSNLKNFQFTSGRIESKTNVSAGPASPRIRMMARAKLAPGFGMWPAFWSYGDPWPTQGEIDIMEARGQEPLRYVTNYFFGTAPGINLVSNAASNILSASNLQTCWHVYEVIWTQQSLTFSLDGQVVHVNSGGFVPDIFGKTQRVTLNLAVGGNFFGPTPLDPGAIQPGTFEVDWVRVYRSN